MITDELNCDIDEWIREAETSTQDFIDKKEKLAPFKNAGWRDNGSTHLSYYKRFTTKTGAEYFTQVGLSDDGNLVWTRGGGLTNLGSQQIRLEDADKIIQVVKKLEERVASQ